MNDMQSFFINCPMLKKFEKKSQKKKKKTSTLVKLAPSLECLLILPLAMIETLDFFPKLTSLPTNSFNCENNFFLTTHVFVASCIKVSNIFVVYIWCCFIVSQYQILLYLDGVCLFYLFILQFHLTFWLIVFIPFTYKTLHVWLVFRFRSFTLSIRIIFVIISISIVKFFMSSTSATTTTFTTLLATTISRRCFTLHGLL